MDSGASSPPHRPLGDSQQSAGSRSAAEDPVEILLRESEAFLADGYTTIALGLVAQASVLRPNDADIADRRIYLRTMATYEAPSQAGQQEDEQGVLAEVQARAQASRIELNTSLRALASSDADTEPDRLPAVFQTLVALNPHDEALRGQIGHRPLPQEGDEPIWIPEALAAARAVVPEIVHDSISDGLAEIAGPFRGPGVVAISASSEHVECLSFADEQALDQDDVDAIVRQAEIGLHVTFRLLFGTDPPPADSQRSRCLILGSSEAVRRFVEARGIPKPIIVYYGDLGLLVCRAPTEASKSTAIAHCAYWLIHDHVYRRVAAGEPPPPDYAGVLVLVAGVAFVVESSIGRRVSWNVGGLTVPQAGAARQRACLRGVLAGQQPLNFQSQFILPIHLLTVLSVFELWLIQAEGGLRSFYSQYRVDDAIDLAALADSATGRTLAEWHGWWMWLTLTYQ